MEERLQQLDQYLNIEFAQGLAKKALGPFGAAAVSPFLPMIIDKLGSQLLDLREMDPAARREMGANIIKVVSGLFGVPVQFGEGGGD